MAPPGASVVWQQDSGAIPGHSGAISLLTHFLTSKVSLPFDPQIREFLKDPVP